MSNIRTKIGVSGCFSLFLTVLAAFLVLFQPVWASAETNGVIRGIVVDEEGVRLPHARVCLKSLYQDPFVFDSNVRKEVEAPLPSEIDFEFTGLKAGTYDLSGIGEGIEPVSVVLKEGQMTREDIRVPTCREVDLIQRMSQAVSDDEVDQVRKLLALGADPNQSFRSTPVLILASVYGGLEMVQTLVEGGADIHVQRHKETREKIKEGTCVFSPMHGLTPYENALWHGHPNAAAYLLAQGASTNDLILPPPGTVRGQIIDEFGTPITNLTIYLASPLDDGRYPHAESTDSQGRYLFLSVEPITWNFTIPSMTSNPVLSVPLTSESPVMEMPLLQIPRAVSLTQHLNFNISSIGPEELKELLQQGVDVNASSSGGETLLMRQVRYGTLDAVRVLVEAGVDLDAENDNAMTALDSATKRNQTEIITYLLEQGARPSDEELPPPGIISGFLQDEQGQPLDYVLLQCSPKGQLKFNDPVWMTLSGGTIHFPNLELGDYQIRLQGLPEPIQTVTLTESEPIQANLIFRSPRQATLNRALWCQLQFDGPYVLELLEAGADASFQPPETGHTTLMVAYPLSPTNARALLEAGADVNRTNHTGQTALMSVIKMWKPDPEVVQVLLEAGADVTPSNQEGNTALHLACKCGDLKIVNLLLEAGAKLDGTNQEGRTPLDLAVWGGHEDVAQTLRAVKAPGQVTKSKPLGRVRGTVRDGGGIPMHYSEVQCCSMGLNPGIPQRSWSGREGQYEFTELQTGTYEIRLADSTNISRTVHLTNRNQVVVNIDLGLPQTEHLNWQLLRCASSKYGRITELIEKGADPNAQDQDSGDTPLHYAVSHQLFKKVRALLEAGANVNARNHREETALMCAAEENHKRTIKILLEAGALINATNQYGKTALMRAVENDRRKNLIVLLEAGADIHRLDHMDCTALHLACEKGHQDIAMALIDAGADLQATNRWDRTPLDEAVWEGHEELADALRAKGAAGTLTAPKPSGSISGVVVDEEENPIRNVRFQVMRMAKNGERSDGCSGIRTGADGSFVKRGEVAGCYRFASASQLDAPPRADVFRRRSCMQLLPITMQKPRHVYWRRGPIPAPLIAGTEASSRWL